MYWLAIAPIYPHVSRFLCIKLPPMYCGSNPQLLASFFWGGGVVLIQFSFQITCCNRKVKIHLYCLIFQNLTNYSATYLVLRFLKLLLLKDHSNKITLSKKNLNSRGILKAKIISHLLKPNMEGVKKSCQVIFLLF